MGKIEFFLIGLSLGILISLLSFYVSSKEKEVEPIVTGPILRTPFFRKEKPKKKPLIRDEYAAWKQENDRANQD